MKSLFLYPGHLVATAEVYRISTMLGSCVSVYLFDKSKSISGLNHYLLPELPKGQRVSARYGRVAIPELIKIMENLGSSPANMKAQVFGGASVLTGVTIASGIGASNVRIAEDLLTSYGIEIVERDVLGSSGRKISIDTKTFQVKVQLAGENSTDLSGFTRPPVKSKIKVGIIDDSPTVRNIFSRVFEKNGIEVVGLAANAFEAREMIVNHRPDVITLDIEMPQMSGVDFLEKLMTHMPMPVVMVSSLDSNATQALRALELGAIEFVQKPSQFDASILKHLGEVLIPKVLAAASRVKQHSQRVDPVAMTSHALSPTLGHRLVVIGGNTGATQVLHEALGCFAANAPPVLVAISTLGFAAQEYINNTSRDKKLASHLCLAQDGTKLKNGHVYLVDSKQHCEVVSMGSDILTRFRNSPPVFGNTPSSDLLFDSAGKALGQSVLGILLSAFGEDGIRGAQAIKASGGTIIIQDPETAEYPHLLQMAISEGLADYVCKPSEILSCLATIKDSAA